MPDFTISSAIKNVLPDCRMGIIHSNVKLEKSSKALLEEIDFRINNIRDSISIEEVSSLPLIEQTKNAYRILGKDPSRYRPSAEALTRRIVQGKGLYQVNNIVDLLNLVSIRSGYSIGGYDTEYINGKVELTIGMDNEPYEAIGRGTLNIHLLPVLRDKNGVFGSPTSDSTRTMARETTRQFLMVFFDFMSDFHIHEAFDMAEEYLEKYGSTTEIDSFIID